MLTNLLKDFFTSFNQDPLVVLYGLPLRDYGRILFDVNYLLSYLHHMNNDFAAAGMYLSRVKTQTFTEKIEFMKMLLKLKSKGVCTDFIEKVSKQTCSYDISFLPRCPNCDICQRNMFCSHDSWPKTYSQLMEYREKGDEANLSKQSTLARLLMEYGGQE